MVMEGDPNQTVLLKVQAELENMEALYKQYQELFDKVGAYMGDVISREIDDADAKASKKAANSTRTGRGGTKTDPEAEKEAKAFSYMASSLGTISDVGISIVRKTFGLVESIYAQLKKSSPLLQAVEQLFNLAWQLFFMPIGNKLGEMLIPAVIQLMDDVMEIWDAFEGMSLGEMLEYAIVKGVEILSGFILTVADILKGEKGLVGAIGLSLEALGNFIENTGAQFLTSIVNLMTFIISNLKEIISTIIAFKVASLTMQAISMYVNATTGTVGGWLGAGIVAATAGTAFLLSEVGLTNMGVPGAYASGGHVPATPGGQLAIVGEGGEGEWIIPDSQMGSIGGNTYNITIQSYSTEELTSKVQSIVSGQISASRLRSGF